jgi:T5SS/PEP-CTERM-associated repeat protein
VSNTIGYLGRFGSDSSGSITVNGGGSAWTNSGDVFVGNSGTGELHVTAGGSVSNLTANIGLSAGSTGTATIDGADSVWTNSSVLAVGVLGTGTLNITGGGVVASTNGRVAREAGSRGTVLIDGPGSRWNASGVFTMGMTGVVFAGPTAELEVRNGGVLSAAGGMTVGLFGVVRGDGVIAANVSSSGSIVPGNSTAASTGTLHVTGNFAQSGAFSTMSFDLASNANFDKLTTGGSMTVGGQLYVQLTGDYVPHGGQSFDILDWGIGGFSGAFSGVFLPTLGGTLVWDASQLYTTGVLSVTGPPAPALAADFDADGDVDGADLAQWQGDFGPSALSDADDDGDSDGADFLMWQQQLGSGAMAGGASYAVPEPRALTLASLVTGCLVLRTSSMPMGRRQKALV